MFPLPLLPRLLPQELDAPVEYIVLPTFAYEHKIFVGPFSRRFPKAKVWVAPRWVAWPVDPPAPAALCLPSGLLPGTTGNGGCSFGNLGMVPCVACAAAVATH